LPQGERPEQVFPKPKLLRSEQEASPRPDQKEPAEPTTRGRAATAEKSAEKSAERSAEKSADRPRKEKQEQVFSGPQVGEKLPPLKVVGAYDDDAGKELDFVTHAAGKPIVLVFVHEGNRPSIGLTRALTTYTVSRAKDGVGTGIVWLGEDATEAEATLKRIRHALTPGAPTGISVDGKEGPGSYGLNRNVTLTILVGKEGKVTANFAIVQPSLQEDLPKILKEIVPHSESLGRTTYVKGW
jgi:hypothetical protein